MILMITVITRMKYHKSLITLIIILSENYDTIKFSLMLINLLKICRINILNYF